MAATAEANRLTEAHRLAQNRLGRRIVAQLAAIFPLLDPTDLNGTVTRWLTAAIPIIGTGRITSSRLAANYLQVFRGLELGVDAEPVDLVLAEALSERQVATSLVITGVASIRAGAKLKRPTGQLVDVARTRSAAAGMRHVLNGGRDTITSTVAADAQALGWARATSGRSCSFCALLASRGPVYGEDSVGFEAHDHCSCSAEPVYRHDAEWPAGAREYRRIYDEVAKGLPSAEARAAFRQALA